MSKPVEPVEQGGQARARRGVKTVRWDATTLQLCIDTTDRLRAEGLTRPNIRSLLYRFLKRPGWTKQHYNTLSRKLGEWRDQGRFPYGVFSDVRGSRRRPQTQREIDGQIEMWRSTEPARLPRDGYLRALLVEHEGLVAQIDDWCNGRALIVSSAGQLRRENLWTASQEWKLMLAELGGKGIKIYALMDWDEHGRHAIFEAHRRWFRDVAGMALESWGLSATQLERLGLPASEDWQIDGAFGQDPAWWRDQIRRLLKVTGHTVDAQPRRRVTA